MQIVRTALGVRVAHSSALAITTEAATSKPASVSVLPDTLVTDVNTVSAHHHQQPHNELAVEQLITCFS